MKFAEPFEVRADGKLVGTYRTYERAMDATVGLLAAHNRYDISERVAGHLFNRAFGYNAGTTSTKDLAAMGVPIHPNCLSDET